MVGCVWFRVGCCRKYLLSGVSILCVWGWGVGVVSRFFEGTSRFLVGIGFWSFVVVFSFVCELFFSLGVISEGRRLG